MADYLVRALSEDGLIRLLAAVTTETVEEARRRHDTWPVATAALGRALTAAALLGANLKGRETLALRIAGGGPLGTITAETDGEGNLRGYVHHPHVDLPLNAQGKLDVGAAVGRQGQLVVIRDMGLKEPYVGSAPLVSGEIAEDLTRYLWTSEQTPSAVALGVLVAPEGRVQAAGGYLLQLMPATREEHREQLEENIRNLGAVSSAIDAGMSPEEMAARVLAGFAYRILDKQPLRFRCRCSRERVAGVLVSLGAEELRRMEEEDGGAEVTCEFCGERYHFTGAELAALREEAARPPDPPRED
ncbi:MAG: Hsp33 family molecular chaperone HslO [Bacillota bacterium]|nr:MAG: Hsp33 family molecular chaperone HslO [Bacillota bacterium]